MIKNKKGQLLLSIFIVIIIIFFVIGILWIGYLFFRNTGSSTDIAYGTEQSRLWYKLYLKDDHKTVYCIDKDDNNLIKIAESAAINKDKIRVFYQEYFFRGLLCSLNDPNYNSVVVTNIEVLK